MAIELYVSRAPFPSVNPPAIATTPQPFTPGGDGASPIGQALANTGAVLSQIGEQIRAAQTEAQVARATTGYLTDLNAAENEFLRDPDYNTSPQRFAELRSELEARYLGELPASSRPQVELNFRRAGLSSQNSVEGRALGRLADQTAADLDAAEAQWLTRFAAANSDAERKAAQLSFEQMLEGPVSTGLITAQNAEARQRRFGALTDNAKVLQLIRDNPERAVKELDNPENYPGLDPVDLERLRATAVQAQDENAIATLNNRARWDPARASAEAGRVASPEQGDYVFDRAILWNESRTDLGLPAPAAVSALAARGSNLETRGLNANFATRLAAALAAAEAATGETAVITDLYRPPERQAQYYANYTREPVTWQGVTYQPQGSGGGLAAPPGQSRHQRGESADIRSGKVLDWLHQHAGEFGLEFLTGAAFAKDPVHIQLAAGAPNVGADLAGMGPRPDLVSPKGALGLAQLMPDTARAMAAELGLDALEGLDNAGVKELLLENHQLNLQLGRAYWRKMLARYEGSVPLALAAYNAGPGAADRWMEAATAQFGANFTADQLLSVVDFKETKQYIVDAYARLNATTDGAGLSPGARWRGSNQVAETVSAEIRARHQTIIDLADYERSGSTWVEQAKRGTHIGDQAGYLAYLATQQAAAAAGSEEARKELRTLYEAEQWGPMVTEALGMHPAALGQVIDRLRSLADGGASSGADFRRLEVFEAAAESVARGVRENPIQLGERARLYVPIEAMGLGIDPAGDFDAQRAALGYRGRQAMLNMAHYGAVPMPFKPAEAAAIGERLAQATPAEQAGIFGALARALPEPAYRAAVEQIAAGNPLAAAAGRVAAERPELAAEVLRGAAVLKTPGLEEPTIEMRAAFKAAMANTLFPDSGRTAVAEMALALYAARRGSNGTLWDTHDQAAIEGAIAEVAGETVTRNGVQFFAPIGMTAARAEQLLTGLTAEAFATPGWRPPTKFETADEILAEFERIYGRPPGQDEDISGFVTLMRARQEAREQGDPALPVDAASGEVWDFEALGERAVLEQRVPFQPVYRVLIPTVTGSPDGYDPVLRRDGRPFTIDLRDLDRRTRGAGNAARREEQRSRARLDEQLGQDLVNKPFQNPFDPAGRNPNAAITFGPEER